ncbi:hydrolase [Streptomyces sp. SA15]|nr:hydrolase [Streptomyces sp. SA15]
MDFMKQALGRNAAVHDAGLSNSPTPARPSEATDEQLSAELKKWSGATPAVQPVGELLDRHWEAAFAYARLCTDGPRAAGMLTTAAFTRLFGESLRQTGPTSAWRPHLLVTVRRIAAEWDTDGRREQLHPELRTEGDSDRVAARLLPPPNRRLLSGAFQRLPQSARCLLWHTEVEAEPLGIPAALLGFDEEDAGVEVRRAHERLREECLQLHRELAPEQECRHYLRLLDVTYRRGGVDIDADLRGHLDGCRHCRYTADQLRQFNQGLGVALAEAVLGWGARAYQEARARVHAVPEEAETPAPAIAGESFFSDAVAEPRAASGGPFPPFPPMPASPPAAVTGDAFGSAAMGSEAFGSDTFGSRAETFGPEAPAPRTGPRTAARAAARTGGPRPASRRSAHKAARRAARRNLAVAVMTVSGLIVLPLVLWSSLDSSDGTAPAEDGRAAETPGADTGTSTSDPSWADAEDAKQGTLRGRLHNVSSGLCVGVAGNKAVKGAETELTTCSSDPSQRWSYEPDGLLRNAEDPDLCLDSHLGYSVRLAPCTGAEKPDTKNVRYDFTLQGTLVPRWSQDLALAPAATDGGGALVLKTRDDGSAQRWVIDTSKTDLQMEVVNWETADTPSKAPEPTTPEPPKTPTPTPTPTPSATPSTPKPSPTPTNPYPTGDASCYYNPYACSWNGQDGQYGWGGYNGYNGYGYGSPDGRR